MANDERNSGVPGSGGGGGDDPNAFDIDEDKTVVIVSRAFLVGALGRASNALYGAGDVCLEARALVTAGAGASSVADLIEELKDLSQITAGMARALENLEFEKET